MELNNFDPFWLTLILSVHVIFVYMTVWFAVSLVKKRNDVADIAWGVGFLVAALVPLFVFGFTFDRSLLVTVLVAIWGIRLSSHIYKRNRNKPEDKRYAEWRVSWGGWFYLRSFFQVFMLQGCLLLLVVSPVLFINTFRGGSEITFFDVLGLLIWIVGFIFESVGDRQLKNFIADPQNKGKIMDKGLWQYTRHPNYFGEVSEWWGIFIIALSVPFGYFGIIGPLTISFLILKVSGIPLLEKGFAGRADFEEYKRKTNAFFPWFRK